MLDLNRMLLAAGYSPELIWAPSYLGPGPGQFDGSAPHTNNVGEVRDFINSVCTYLDVDVVDGIAHSLGCSLIYAICRGLEKRARPISWGESKKWHRLGTFVALDGAFHGLSPFSQDEWGRNGEFMRELLTETEGGGGETPYIGREPTDPGADPSPHHLLLRRGPGQRHRHTTPRYGHAGRCGQPELQPRVRLGRPREHQRGPGGLRRLPAPAQSGASGAGGEADRRQGHRRVHRPGDRDPGRGADRRWRRGRGPQAHQGVRRRDHRRQGPGKPGGDPGPRSDHHPGDRGHVAGHLRYRRRRR